MEASMSPTMSISYSESFLVKKRVKLPSWNRCLASISPPRAVAFAQSLILIRKPSVKVLCSQKREIPVVEGRCIDEIYDALAERLAPTAAVASNPNLKHIVGLAGPPGAGKSTLASEVARRVNKLWPQKAFSIDSQVKPPDVATVLPMDGFHLYRSQLDEMENPEEAHARRGGEVSIFCSHWFQTLKLVHIKSFDLLIDESAPWTFNPALLLSCLQTLKAQGSVYVPSFDHGIGDPVEDDIFVSLQHKVVIVEGNYLLLEDGVWKEISSIFDEK